MRTSLVVAFVGLVLGAPLWACEGAPPAPTFMRRDAGPCELRTEVCDGRDNDCNGIVDDRGLPELCDGLDQDCDGAIDEGAPCDVWSSPGMEGWTLGPTSSGVLVTGDGALTLEPPRVDLVQPALWIANSDEGTVSRLDPATGRETARYSSVTRATTPDEPPMPSRTALDQRLDAYVANRAFGAVASVTKIAGSLERCVDRDLDGLIDTSADLDGDGRISLDPALGEFADGDDECVLWSVPLGRRDGVARALAIGLAGPDGEPGDVWVGLFSEQRVVLLSSEDGAEIASIPLGLSPYGAVAGPDGRIWLTGGPFGSTFIVSVDPESFATERVPLPANTGTYGISVDGMGRVILAAIRAPVREEQWHGVVAYDPSSERWSESVALDARDLLRGIAASGSAVWVAGRGPAAGAVLFELSVSDLSLIEAHALPTAADLVGVGVAFDGRVWGVGRGSDAAYRLDPSTGLVEEFPVGDGPYTYSDFTGFGLNGILGATGLHRVTVEGCDGAYWTGLRLDADVPEHTAVVLSVRSADTLARLAAAPWIGPFDPPEPSLVTAPGPVGAGRFLEISLRLSSTTPGIVPRVRSITAVGRCDEVG